MVTQSLDEQERPPHLNDAGQGDAAHVPQPDVETGNELGEAEAELPADLEKGIIPNGNTAQGDGEEQSSGALAVTKEDEKPKRSTAKIAVIMFALCMAVFLAALDQTIVTTALPTISHDFHSTAAYTWVGSAYLLGSAAAGPVWSKISDIFGRKPILLSANGTFFVGSVICGWSRSTAMLIAGRAIQGVGGGGLLVMVNVTISDLFSLRSRGQYFGLVGMTWALASAVGPVLGGVFTEEVTWRWAFWVNLPITGTCFMVLLLFLDVHTPTTPLVAGLKAIDWIGALTIQGGVVMFLLGLEFGGVDFPWSSPTVICLIIFGLFTGFLFVLNEWKLARYPIISLRLFQHRSNIAVLVTATCHGMVFIAGSYFLPLYFQAVLGATPILSGVYLLPWVLSLSVLSAVSGVVIRKTGKYLPNIWFGVTLMLLGSGLYISFGPTANWAKIVIFQMIVGIGVGPNFQSPLIALQTKVNPKDIAASTATFYFLRSLSTAISVVIGSVIFQNGMQQRAGTLAAVLDPTDAALLSGSAAGANVAIIKTLTPVQQVVVKTAFTQSLRDIWIFYTCMAALGVVASAFIGKKVLTKEHTETKTGLEAEEEKRKEEAARRELKRQEKLERRNGSPTAAHA